MNIWYVCVCVCAFRTVVAQPYQPEILTEYVIRGNSAILKCSIPSYIAEFVTVEAWIREDGEVYIPEDPAVGQGTRGVSSLSFSFFDRSIHSHEFVSDTFLQNRRAYFFPFTNFFLYSSNANFLFCFFDNPYYFFFFFFFR